MKNHLSFFTFFDSLSSFFDFKIEYGIVWKIKRIKIKHYKNGKVKKLKKKKKS
jgi:hypothetical protein